MVKKSIVVATIAAFLIMFAAPVSFAAQKAAGFAKRFQPGELVVLYRRLFDLERSVKTGECDMEDGLYRFVFSLPSR